MNRTKIAQLYADAESLGGQTVTAAGWVKSVRDMKNFWLCYAQRRQLLPRPAGRHEPRGTRQLRRDRPSKRLGRTHLHRHRQADPPMRPSLSSFLPPPSRSRGTSAPDYPLQKKRATVEFLRTQQHLRPRTNLFRAVFRIRSVAAAAIHRFFQEQGFVYVNTPIITTSDCEGAGEMFRVTTLDPKNPPLTESGEVDWSQDFFGKHASLTVSGQLNAENFAMAFGDVYTFGPTFRAENSNTTRHAAEFWMIEPEMAFCRP